METAETACPHTMPGPLEPGLVALGGALTDTEWDTLLARFPEGSVERADTITRLLDVITPQRIVSLPLVDVVHVLWMLDDRDPAQGVIAPFVASRSPAFEDWVDVVTRLPQYQSASTDTFALRYTLEQMHVVETSTDWVRLADKLTRSWAADVPQIPVFYRAVIRACGRTAAAIPDLLVAYERAWWDASERIAIFKRLLALSPGFETTRHLEPLLSRSFPPVEPEEYHALSSRYYDRLYEQAATYEQYRELVHIARHGAARPWLADALHALATGASTFDELVDTLSVLGNNARYLGSMQVAVGKLTALTRTSPRPFEEWMKLASWASDESEALYILVLREALAAVSSLEDRLKLLPWTRAPHSPIHRAHRALLRQILREQLTMPQYRWLLLVEREAPRLRRQIFQAMAAQPLDLECAFLLTVLTSPSSPSHAAGAQYLAQAQASFAAWDALLTIRIEGNLRPAVRHWLSPDGVDLEDADFPERYWLVLEKLTPLARTEREWRRVLAIATKAGVMDTQVAARRALALLARQTLTPGPATA